jgi:guanine deaminase
MPLEQGRHVEDRGAKALSFEGNNEFMRHAIQLATENVTSGRGGPFGAVIVKDGVVIATGANHVTASNDPTAHAEVTAIRNACQALSAFTLEGCDIYTSCEPCPMCLAAIYWARCRAIFYGCTAQDAAQAGFDDAFLYGEMKKPLQERALPIENLCAQEALASFEAWNKSPQKVEY